MRLTVRAALVLVLGLWFSAEAAGQEALSKRDASGPVTVIVSLLERPVTGALLRIKVVLDTHSAALDGIQFASAVAVRAPNGSEQPPVTVERSSGSGHHREAVLVFSALRQPGPLTIVVRDVGGVAVRKFGWEVAALK